MKTFTCNIAQPGLFAGHIALVNNEAERTDSDKSLFDSDCELSSFNNAINQLKKELGSGSLSESNSEIIDAMTMIIEDESFINGVKDIIIDKSQSAAYAVEKQTDSIVSALESSGSEYLKNRCEDIRGISHRLIELIEGKAGTIQISETSALVANEISPVLLSSIQPELIGAIVSDKGSPNSHSSIIAGNLRIPYLFGVGEAISQMTNGQTIVVDGEKGLVILDPGEDTYNSAINRMKALAAERESLEQEGDKVTCKTKIMANISGPEDIPDLLKAGADGIGLFRTELLFLNSPEAPTEEEQYTAYASVLEAMQDKEVIIRTMDLGSDKTAAWLKLPKEINPALGLRGARVSLEREDLLNTQLRALLRAATKGNLKVMFPMIISEWEVDELIKAVNAAARELENEGVEHSIPELGIMIETPSAVIIADRLAEKVSFFSIGTNDLTQYTLGLDRESEGLDRFFDPRHEAVLRLIEMTAQKAHEKGITVGICGQLAADPQVTRRLVASGIDELSVAASKVKTTRANAAKAEKETANNDLEIAAVADGELIPMKSIPDEAFAEGILGPCVGILPENGNVYSPCDGIIKSIADTQHAIVVESNDGTQYMVHMGIETVNMKGKAFDVRIEVGQAVSSGDLIAIADLKAIEKEGFSTIIVTIRLNY